MLSIDIQKRVIMAQMFVTDWLCLEWDTDENFAELQSPDDNILDQVMNNQIIGLAFT
jgi:ABC-type transport system involved in cytochrome c biogenesis ATPase subunit